MAESFTPAALPSEKTRRYAELLEEIQSVIEGEPNRVARMATVASMLAASFETYFWTGFYVVDPDRDAELVVDYARRKRASREYLQVGRELLTDA